MSNNTLWMTIIDFAKKTQKIAKDHGLTAAARSATHELYAKTLLRPYVRYRQERLKRRVTPQIELLNALRSQDEYTLLVFDTGRYDYMAPLLREFFEGDVTETFSHARSTFEWSSDTWKGDYSDVTYVTGMVPVTDAPERIKNDEFRKMYNGVNPGDHIGEIVKVWDTHWDRKLSTVPPDAVTEQALNYADRDKLVVHYCQPHSPYIGTPKLIGHSGTIDAEPNTGRPNDEPIWQGVRTGKIPDAYLRMAYWGNAVTGLEAVEPLVKARENVVATADHGEALGEFGMYTHDHAPHPKRRSVPWMEIEGMKEMELEESDSDLNDRLEALGYV